MLVSGERLLEGIVERVLRFVRTCANRHEGARTNASASSLIRVAAELPNQLWQIDAAHWSLAGARSVEISYHNARRVGP